MSNSKLFRMWMAARETDDSVEWQGAAGADVSILQGDKEPVEQKADKAGHVEFKSTGGGLVGVLVNTMEKDKSGELDGKPYKGVMHYATLTFNMPGQLKLQKKRKRRRRYRRHRFGASSLPICQNRSPVLAAWFRMAGCTYTAVTRAKNTSTRPRIYRTTFAVSNSKAVKNGKNYQCERRCKVCHWWPTTGKFIESAG